MNKSILIIGDGQTGYKINSIHKVTNFEHTLSQFQPASPMASALRTIKGFDQIDIYIANIVDPAEYVPLLDTIKQFNFDFVIPVGVRFSDTTINVLTGQRLYYTELFLRAIGSESDSILIMTDVHASLYEDIDHYLKDMLSKVRTFKESSTSRIDDYRGQLWLVANHLKYIDYANVLLGAVCAESDAGTYPTYKFPEAIFDIDAHDVKRQELIYFKNNLHTYNSIENFVNFNLAQDVYKVASIDLVIRHINRTIDLSDAIGKLYNNSTKLRIRSKLQEYLTQMKGSIIKDYSIVDIKFEVNADYSYTVLCFFKVVPINSLEECKILIEVR